MCFFSVCSFLPNSTTTNYLKTQKDIGAECPKNRSKGVIFINIDKEGFYSLDNEKQSTTITHEVGHTLKLCHSDKPIDDQSGLSQTVQLVPKSIMRELNSKISNYITLYDKSSLIKKWREMP